MDVSPSTLEADDRANELYWGSDRSVNQIADELDLSKGALYGMIRPLAAALSCADCGAEVVHSNRTAKERGLVECPACGWDGTEGEAVPRAPDDEVSPQAKAAPAPAERELGPPPRAIAGGALLGAAAGLALVLWLRRR